MKTQMLAHLFANTCKVVEVKLSHPRNFINKFIKSSKRKESCVLEMRCKLDSVDLDKTSGLLNIMESFQILSVSVKLWETDSQSQQWFAQNKLQIVTKREIWNFSVHLEEIHWLLLPLVQY